MYEELDRYALRLIEQKAAVMTAGAAHTLNLKHSARLPCKAVFTCIIA